MNFLTTTFARILFGAPLIMFGINHFMYADQMAGMVPSFYPGGGALWVYIVGAGLIASGLSVIIRVMDKIGMLALAGLMVGLIINVHVPGIMSEDPMMKQMGMISMLKDLIIAGGALAFAGMSGKK